MNSHQHYSSNVLLVSHGFANIKLWINSEVGSTVLEGKHQVDELSIIFTVAHDLHKKLSRGNKG